MPHRKSTEDQIIPLYKLIDKVIEVDPSITCRMAWYRIRQGRLDPMHPIPHSAYVLLRDAPFVVYHLVGLSHKSISRQVRNDRTRLMYHVLSLCDVCFAGLAQYSS